MLRDGILDHLALVGNGVELDLFRLCHELRYHHGELLRHLCRHVQEAMQLLLIVTHVHRSTREHIRRTHEYGIAHLVHKLLHIIERGQCLPRRLVDTQFVEHGRELIAVLGTVDIHRTCTQYGHTLTVQFHSEVVRNLTTHGDDHPLRLFEVDHVEHTLQ